MALARNGGLGHQPESLSLDVRHDQRARRRLLSHEETSRANGRAVPAPMTTRHRRSGSLARARPTRATARRGGTRFAGSLNAPAADPSSVRARKEPWLSCRSAIGGHRRGNAGRRPPGDVLPLVTLTAAGTFEVGTILDSCRIGVRRWRRVTERHQLVSAPVAHDGVRPWKYRIVAHDTSSHHRRTHVCTTANEA